MSISYNTLEKKSSHAFKNTVFLLGEDKYGIKYWLEAPSWDCDHYWGFGYIETYSYNNNPSTSRDINSHEHAGNFMDWCIEWNGKVPKLSNTTFTQKEAWELCELFKRFQLFKDLAGYYTRGGCHIAEVSNDYITKDLDKAKEINQGVLKDTMDRIIKIIRGL